MALTTSDCSEQVSPARPFTVAASVPSVIAAPSVLGVLALQVSVGASGLPVTASVMLAVLVRPSPSTTLLPYATLFRSSLVGVTRRLDKVQPATLIEVLPALAVKL